MPNDPSFRPWGFLAIEATATEVKLDILTGGRCLLLGKAAETSIRWVIPETAEGPWDLALIVLECLDGERLWLEARRWGHPPRLGEKDGGILLLPPSWALDWGPHDAYDGRPLPHTAPIPHTQTRTGVPRGNCTETALASLLGVPVSDLPDLFAELGPAGRIGPWSAARDEVLLRRGVRPLGWAICIKDFGDEGGPTMQEIGHGLTGVLWIACGRNPEGVGHVVLAMGPDILWDTNPRRLGIVGPLTGMRLLWPREKAAQEALPRHYGLLVFRLAFGALLGMNPTQELLEDALNEGSAIGWDDEIPPPPPAVPVYQGGELVSVRPWPKGDLTVDQYLGILCHLETWRQQGYPRFWETPGRASEIVARQTMSPAWYNDLSIGAVDHVLRLLEKQRPDVYGTILTSEDYGADLRIASAVLELLEEEAAEERHSRARSRAARVRAWLGQQGVEGAA